MPLTRAEEAGKKSPRLVRAAARIAVIAQWPDKHKCLFVRHQTKGLELPGGAIDPNEVPLQTSLRELREEAGMQLSADCRLMLIDMVPIKDQRGGSWLDIIYGTIVTPLQITVQQEAEFPIFWLTLEEIREMVDRQLSSYKTALIALRECVYWTY
ncbi:MAG: NUDIX domain-containing protein [Chloroflexi bacterium]|nr:NUDIX domain-containing protein [Chloroflexota bacterium]